MTDSDSAGPLDSAAAETADAGPPEEVDETRAMDDQQPDYDDRQAAVSEDRKPAGPPLPDDDSGDGPPTRAQGQDGDDEPPVDPN